MYPEVPRVDVHCEPGGEGYVKWAKAKLRALGEQRADLRLPSLRKNFQVGTTRVLLKSAEFGDKIWIFRSGGGGFVATLYARKISPSELKTFSTGRQPAFRPFEASAWEYLGTASTHTTAQKPFVQGDVTRTPHSGGSSYFEKKVNTTFGSSGASYTALGVFKHDYTVAGVPQSELVQLGTNGTFYRLVSGVRTALTMSGSTGTLDTFTSSADGRALVAYDTGGTAYRAVIDMALPTPVVWSTIVDDVYGTQRVVSSTANVSISSPPGGYSFVSNASSSETTVQASFPLSRGVTAAAADAVIWVDYAKTSRDVIEQAANLGNSVPIPGVLGFGNGSSEDFDAVTATIRLPGGGQKTFTLEQTNKTTSGTYSQFYTGVVSIFSFTGGGTRASSSISGSVNVIYADPVAGIVFYEYERTQTDYTDAGAAPGGGFASYNQHYDIVTSVIRELGVITDAGNYVIETVTVSSSAGTFSEGVATGTGASNQGNSSSGSDNTTNVTTELFSIPASPRKSYPFGHLTSGTTRYSATAKTAPLWLLSQTKPNPSTGEYDSFKLYQGVGGSFADVTAPYLTYLSASLPQMIGGPDQAVIAAAQAQIDSFTAILNDPAQVAALAVLLGVPEATVIALLNSLIANQQAIINAELAKPPGVPNPDVALVLSNPEMFEIRAENLTYV